MSLSTTKTAHNINGPPDETLKKGRLHLPEGSIGAVPMSDLSEGDAVVCSGDS
jgi:hypothetical protein